MNGRRRLLKEYIRDDADEELDYLTIIPYAPSDAGSYISRIAIDNPYYVKMTNGSEYYSDIWYSVDGGEWVLYSEGFIDVPSLSKIRFKGNWHEIMKDVEFIRENVSEAYTPKFYSESGYDWWLLEGTPLSLLHGDNFKERKNDWNPYWDTFYTIFENSQSVAQINNPKTFLPSTELGEWCYQRMFAGSRIANAPELPAETLKEGCYCEMFFECSYLEEAPALNAKTLVPDCYNFMLRNCLNLHYVKVTAIDGFDAAGATNNMVTGSADYGLVVLSNELIDANLEGLFLANWTIISEDYPTNEQGYPNTESFTRYELCAINLDFVEQDEYYLESYYSKEPSEVGVNLYKLITDGTWKSYPIYVNRCKVVGVSYSTVQSGVPCTLDYKKYNNEFKVTLNSDGSMVTMCTDYIIRKYIKNEKVQERN